MTIPDHSELLAGAKRRANTGRSLNRFEVLALLGDEVRRQGSIRAASRFYLCSAPYLHDVLTGRRNPGPKVLRPLGLKVKAVTTTLEYVPEGKP